MNNAHKNAFTSKEWCGVRQADLDRFIRDLRGWAERNGRPKIVLRNELRRAFRQFVQASQENERRYLRESLGDCIERAEEVIFVNGDACFVLRREPGRRQAFLVRGRRRNGRSQPAVELLTERRYLSLRESMILDQPVSEQFMFGIDFRPFRIIAAESGTREDIGEGTGRIASLIHEEIRRDPEHIHDRIIDYLSDRTADGRPLFFTERLDNRRALRWRIDQALDFLTDRPAQESAKSVQREMSRFGFAAGWGSRVAAMRRSLLLLRRLLEEPNEADLLELFQRLPILRRVLLISVHGWFAQDNVLGRPDTGGQVVYLLDQARALEKHLKQLWADAGVPVKPDIMILARLIPEADGTTCDRRKEKIRGTENAWILRVPFRDEGGQALPHWISRFHVWPYLERLAHEAHGEVMKVWRGASPDLVIGNYSDGNLVASLLGREWGVPIAVIAHALEKMKYLMSDLFWRELEENYHFSIHFLSDILAMNSADFIQVSSYQEIAGTPGEMGQYESYELFTLPGCYRVISGVNIHSARFVINPPGTDTDIYHPHTERRPEDRNIEQEIERLVTGKAKKGDGVVGRLSDAGKPVLFTMARLDRIKNLTGLVKAYAKRPALRQAFDLLIVSGETQLERSDDHEEREQILYMHKLFEQHSLHENACWIPAELGQGKFPHYYRFTARRHGIFVQPAIFEAFGLTVLEAMACGLPVIATRFGGPAYIIEDGANGFLYDPNRAAELEKAALRLLNGVSPSGGTMWDFISDAGLRRVHEHFSWPGHALRLSTAHGLYGLWNHLFPERRQVRRTYVDSIHHLLFKRLVAEIWPSRAGDREDA